MEKNIKNIKEKRYKVIKMALMWEFSHLHYFILSEFTIVIAGGRKESKDRAGREDTELWKQEMWAVRQDEPRKRMEM